MSDLLLEALGIVRRYAGNTALKGVDFRVHRGQCNVLIGENGAGKSTLMRILAGVESPDEGQLLLNGMPITLHSPRDAAAHGIAIVHQELSVLPNLDISDNIFAGRELTRAGVVVDREHEDQDAGSALERLRHLLPVKTPALQLSLGERQIVELARVIAHGAQLLILDEPTSALSITEADSLFRVLAEMKAAGVTIIYISHRLHELLHLGDNFTVLRSGQVVGEAVRGEATREWIVDRMSGRTSAQHAEARSFPSSKEAALLVRNLSVSGSLPGEESSSPVHDVSFSLHRGEILGLYGLLGAGRTELLETLAGHRRRTEGEVLLKGHPVPASNVPAAMRAGMALVPEDRQRDGLIPELSVRENIALAASGMLLSKSAETVAVRQLIEDLQIVVKDIELPVTALSGGNQQKVLLARCLMCSPSVLLLDEPTRGVDAVAKAEIYRTLRALASRGLGILFTSSEIEETRELAERVLVLCQGRIAAEFTRSECSDEALFAAASPRVAATFHPPQGARA